MQPYSNLEKSSFNQFCVNIYNFVDQSRVDFHEFCNYIPGVSTVTNLIAVFQKHVFLPEADSVESLTESRYYTYLRAQDFQKDWLLFIPFANTIFCLLRCCSTDLDTELKVDVETNMGNEIMPSDKVEKLYIEELELKTKEQLSKIINEVLPEASPEQMTLSSNEISKICDEFFLELNDCQFNSVNYETYALGKKTFKHFFQNLLNSFEDASPAQITSFIQGLRGCGPIPTVETYHGCGHTDHRFDLIVEMHQGESLWFPEVFKLYESNPDLAKLLINGIILSYCTPSNTTNDNRQIDFLCDCIRTKEQAIDYLNACDNLTPSIKEDNQRKLALYTQDYKWITSVHNTRNLPRVFVEKGMNDSRKISLTIEQCQQEKIAIIEAFNEKGIDYTALLSKDCFPIISQDIANKIYSQLSVVDLATISKTRKPTPDLENEKPSSVDFLKKHLEPLTTQLIRLVQLLNMIKSGKFIASYTFVDTGRTAKATAYFYKELNIFLKNLIKNPLLLSSLKPLKIEKCRKIERSMAEKVTLSFSQLKNDTEYFIEDKTFNEHVLELIETEVFDGQKFENLPKKSSLISNCLTVLFDQKSDEFLRSFIAKKSFFGRRDIENVLFNELTEIRQERLISLIKNNEPKFGHVILLSLFKFIEWNSAKSQANESELVKLAEKLTIAFYNEKPDFFQWTHFYNREENLPSSYVECLCIAETLHFLEQPILKENSCQENLRRWTCERATVNASIARCLKSPEQLKTYLEKTLAYILSEENDKFFVEEKLITFTHIVLIHELYSISDNFKALLEVSASLSHHQMIDAHAIIFKAIFQLFCPRSSIYELFPYVKTETEVGILLENLRKLPEPIKSFHLSVLKEHICKEENGFSKDICDIFKSEFEFSELELNQIKKNGFRIQHLVDSFLSLESPKALKRCLQEFRKDQYCLQALAQGIKLPDGTLLKNSLSPEIIRQAFHDEKLYYEGYEEPIDLVEFIKEYY
ncbi:MAG: hypothetical protein H0T62_13455 [Parachlamydiaceae bacterium]|nr:hypothetical protein [Parachlamydiaceae bacterium]